MKPDETHDETRDDTRVGARQDVPDGVYVPSGIKPPGGVNWSHGAYAYRLRGARLYVKYRQWGAEYRSDCPLGEFKRAVLDGYLVRAGTG